MFRGQALSAPSSAAHTFIRAIIDNIFRLDLGQQRERNDHTLDTRADHFSRWIDHDEPPLATLLEKGPASVNLTLSAYHQWVGGAHFGGKIPLWPFLPAYLTVAVTLLEHCGMDDPQHLTCSGQAYQKSHPILARVMTNTS
jgi:hypothetical protein